MRPEMKEGQTIPTPSVMVTGVRGHNRVEWSDELGELATALASAQAEIKHAVKGSENPFHKSRYADLAAVMDACRIPLCKNGLSIVQLPTIDDNGVEVLDTVLLHTSGQWMRSRLAIRPAHRRSREEGGGWQEDTHDPQALGSTITYLRRYALAAIAGVAAEDDDGNAASGRDIPTTGGPAHSARGRGRAPRTRGPVPPSAESSSPAPAPPPDTSGDPDWRLGMPWLDEKLGFGKFATKTWRDLLHGSQGGQGEQYLEWLAKNSSKESLKIRANSIIDLRAQAQEAPPDGTAH